MANPSSSLSTLRPELRSFEEFSTEMDRQGFIGSRVAPVIEVAKASGTYGRIPIEQLLQNPNTDRAPGTGYKRTSFQFTSETYATREQGAESPVDDNDAENYRDYFDAESIAAERCYDAVLRAQESRIAAMIFNTTTWTGAALTTDVSAGAGVEWTVKATATPIVNVLAAAALVYDGSGIWPNSLIVTRKGWRALIQCDEIIDRIKYSGRDDPKGGNITTTMMADVFDLENVIIAGSTTNTASEGATASPASLWTDTMAMVAYISDSRDISRPTLARTFHWGADGSSIGGTIESYRDESVRSDVIRVRHQVQEKVMYPELGHLLTAVTA